MTAAVDSVPIRPAATTILLREGDGIETLMVKRHHQIDFVAGAMVFPGGKLDPDDSDPGWQELVTGWDETPETERALRIAAIRECFEETGIVLGEPGRALDDPNSAEARRRIDRGEASFLAYVQDFGVHIDLRALTLFSRWVTPPVVPKRFDTFFYVARAPEGQVARQDGREAVEAEWIAPTRALELAQAGEREIVFPTRMNLRVLAEHATFDEIAAAARERAVPIVEPEIFRRDGKPYLRLTEADGYGLVEEPLER